MKTILIVDDRADNRNVLIAMLHHRGHRLLEAESGAQALQVARKENPDLIIADVLMPKMDGYELVRRLRDDPGIATIPVIFYTASYIEEEARKLAKACGVHHVIVKPAEPETVFKVVDAVLDEKRPAKAPIAPPEFVHAHLHLVTDKLAEKIEELEDVNAKLEDEIADRRRVERELRATEARLKHLLAHTPAVIYSLRIEGGTVVPVFVSENMQRLLGFTAAEAASLEWWLDRLHPDDRDRALGVLSEALKGDGYSMEYRLRHKDGNYHWVHDDNRVINDEAGRRAEMVGVWTDITQRKGSEERLREQADIIARARDAVIVRDFTTGRVTVWNSGAERIYGWSADEAIGRPIAELIFGESHNREVLLKQLVSTGEFHGEIKHRTKDGHEVLVDARVTLVRNDDGTPRSVMGINTDITEQKKLQTQLLRSQRLESIGTLASGVAHDLNNILTPILMCSEVLKGNLSPEDMRATISMIEDSARRGAGVVKQVLTFARGIEGERVSINPCHLIEEMVDIARKTFPKSIQVTARYPEESWGIQGDPTQLHQVLLNLCVNARDAMPKGGSLAITAENVEVDEGYAAMTPGVKIGPHVVLRVNDTGAGMARETVEKIFDPFFTTKQAGQGTGLGLSTALGIVKSHGGALSVYSEAGRGTTFRVFLPAVVAQTAAATKRAPALVQGNNELILLVDDEEIVRRVARMILEKNKYRVLEASDGPEAVALLARHIDSVDLVLTDIMLPYMDGIAVMRAVKKMKPEMLFIASSGQGDDARLSELQSLNVAQVLSKPYDAGKLLQTVHDALTSGGN